MHTPDYLLGGNIRLELKEIAKNGENIIENAVKKQSKQAHNFAIDISKASLSINEVYFQIDGIYKNKFRKWIETMMIIKDDEILEILNRK